MPMPPYQVYCYTKDCKNPAVYKIAAKWSDGVVRELKTYGLCCADCLPKWFLRGRTNFAGLRLLPNEALEVPGIYVLKHGQRDQTLERRTDLEEQIMAAQASVTSP